MEETESWESILNSGQFMLVANVEKRSLSTKELNNSEVEEKEAVEEKEEDGRKENEKMEEDEGKTFREEAEKEAELSKYQSNSGEKPMMQLKIKEEFFEADEEEPEAKRIKIEVKEEKEMPMFHVNVKQEFLNNTIKEEKDECMVRVRLKGGEETRISRKMAQMLKLPLQSLKEPYSVNCSQNVFEKIVNECTNLRYPEFVLWKALQDDLNEVELTESFTFLKETKLEQNAEKIGSEILKMTNKSLQTYISMLNEVKFGHGCEGRLFGYGGLRAKCGNSSCSKCVRQFLFVQIQNIFHSIGSEFQNMSGAELTQLLILSKNHWPQHERLEMFTSRGDASLTDEQMQKITSTFHLELFSMDKLLGTVIRSNLFKQEDVIKRVKFLIAEDKMMSEKRLKDKEILQEERLKDFEKSLDEARAENKTLKSKNKELKEMLNCTGHRCRWGNRCGQYRKRGRCKYCHCQTCQNPKVASDLRARTPTTY